MGKAVSKTFYAIKNGKKYYNDYTDKYTGRLGDATFWPKKNDAKEAIDEKGDTVISVRVTWEEL